MLAWIQCSMPEHGSRAFREECITTHHGSLIQGEAVGVTKNAQLAPFWQNMAVSWKKAKPLAWEHRRGLQRGLRPGKQGQNVLLAYLQLSLHYFPCCFPKFSSTLSGEAKVWWYVKHKVHTKAIKSNTSCCRYDTVPGQWPVNGFDYLGNLLITKDRTHKNAGCKSVSSKHH